MSLINTQVARTGASRQRPLRPTGGRASTTSRQITRTSGALVLFIAGGPLCAQTITVTTSADSSDVPVGATIADLPGPDGVVSFREALRVSDNEPGRQTIGFAIPESDWYLPHIVPGRVLLQGSFSFSCTQPVIIDGTTQTAFTGDTYAEGNELVIPLQTYLNGGDSIVTGLEGTRVELGGANNEVHGNTGGMDIRFVLATDSIAHDNEADNINVWYSSGCLVARNITQRVRVSGLGMASPATGNVIGGPDPADRNYITGFGNYGEHGTPAGDCVELYYSDNTLIQNNYIGTTPDGMAISNPACTTGIAIWNSNHNVQILDNLIAVDATHALGGGDYGQDIYLDLYEGGSGIVIQGNTMGLNALGEPVLGGKQGVWMSGLAFEEGGDVLIGGQNPGEGNVIARHDSTGILMMFHPGVPASAHVRVSGNSIYSNGEIGVDLMPNTWDFGSTPNDLLDTDDGANGLQNYPVILSAERGSSATTVAGTLDSIAFDAFDIEFFSSPACDPSGFGQGQTYLGTTLVITDASGHASFDVVLPTPVPAGSVVTATATRSATGDTSEFSACATVVDIACPADFDGDGDADGIDVGLFLQAYGTGNAAADLDGDGDTDGIDVGLFLQAYALGCA